MIHALCWVAGIMMGLVILVLLGAVIAAASIPLDKD